MVQWLRFLARNARGLGSIPGQGTIKHQGLPWWLSGKECLPVKETQETWFQSLVRETPHTMEHQAPVPQLLSLCSRAWLPCGSDCKESACNVADPASIPGSGRSPVQGNGNPLQYSCLENPMDREAWWASPWGCNELDRTDTLTFTFLEPGSHNS